MASSQVEFASCLLNRPSTPTTSYRKNIKGYLHSCITPTNSDNTAADSSWLPSSESENSKTQNNVDLSWLPTYNDNNSPSDSDHSNQLNDQDGFDDSWLPNYDTKTNTSTTALKSENSSLSGKTEDDFDHSWLPSTNIVSNGNQNKESSSNKNKKPRNSQHWSRAREVVFSGDQQIQHAKLLNKKLDSSKSQGEVSPSKSECSVETSNLGGVSTLLRRWRDLADARSSNRKAKNTSGSSQSNSESLFTEKNNNNPLGSPSRAVPTQNHNHQRSPPRGSDAFERCGSPSTTEDSFLDWESCKTSPFRPLSCPSYARSTKDSSAVDAEKEKLRVVDIIKKLSREEELAASQAAGNGNELLARVCTTSDHQQVGTEKKGFPCVIASPRLIRGRQAFKDFLMLMEQHKCRELEGLAQRKSVSKFPYRGRIQALLRVRFLQLGVETKTETKSHRHSVLELNPLNIMDQRDRFSTAVKQGATTSRKKNRIGEAMKNDASCESSVGSSPVREMEVNTTTTSQEPKPVITPNRSTQVQVNAATTNSQETESIATSNQLAQEAKDHCQIAEMRSPPKEVVDKVQHFDSSSSIQSEEDTRYKIRIPNREDFHEEGQFLSAKMTSSGMDKKGSDDASHLLSDVGDPESTSNRQALENWNDWSSVYSQPQSDWDEEESYDTQLFHTNQDWISDIARPRSDWELMRQARYKEMLDHYAHNADIRRLLERRSVSSFLSSDLRDRIDQLMMSRAHGVSLPTMCGKLEVAGREDEGESRKEETMEEEFKEEDEGKDEEVDSEEDEDEEGGDRIERQCSEYSDFNDQTTCSSMPAQSPALEERSWNHPNAIYESDQMASPSNWPNPYLQNNTPQSSSFINQPSIEMELIYDLRGHMELLHQEIMELRRSIKSCVNMQVKMQRSIKQTVAAAVAQSGTSTVPGKRSCFICHATQVDSFLYRCGHMCACFDCSLELQCTSGKCPVCEAPIEDVVRAYGYGE